MGNGSLALLTRALARMNETEIKRNGMECSGQAKKDRQMRRSVRVKRSILNNKNPSSSSILGVLSIFLLAAGLIK